MLVTCLVLSYKKFDGIFKALDSLFQQSYKEIELILADDASDNFPEDLTSFIENNKGSNICSVKIIRNSVNLGTVKNMNNAISQATGEYIVVLSADDVFYDNNVIEKIVNRVTKNDLTHLICRRAAVEQNGEFSRYIPNDHEISAITQYDTADKQLNAFLRGTFYNLASGSVFSFYKSFWESMGKYDESYRLWEDGPMFYKIMKKGIMLNTAYDIVSIKYGCEGVSSGKISGALLADDKKFWNNVFKEQSSKMSFLGRRVLKFRILRNHELPGYSGLQKIMFCVRYLDIIIYRRIKKRQ